MQPTQSLVIKAATCPVLKLFDHVAWKVFEGLFPHMNSQQDFDTLSKKHLLWGLYFLKCYPTDRVGAVFVKSSVKTFKKWSKYAVDHVALLFSKK